MVYLNYYIITKKEMPPEQNNNTDLMPQLARIWQRIGLFTKVIVGVNWLCFAAHKIFWKDIIAISTTFGSCNAALFEGQIYRLFTAEFTHGNFSHIIGNSFALLMFGIEVETHYGSLFYASLHFWLMIISQAMDVFYAACRVYLLPSMLFGKDINQLKVCAVGYSNIIFGVLMFYSLTGSESHFTIAGCKFRRILVPFAYLAFSSLAVPNASFSGHLFGILAAFIIKYCGLYKCRLLPQHAWVTDFEKESSILTWIRNVNWYECSFFGANGDHIE